MKRSVFVAAVLCVLCAAIFRESASAAQPVTSGKCRITFPSPLLIPISGTPREVLIDPNCQHAFITNPSNNRVEVVSLQTGRLSAPINVGSSPAGLDITPDGATLYVANSGANTISVVDVAGATELRQIPVPPSQFTNDTPLSIAIANNGLAFLSTTFAGTGFGGRMLQLNLATDAITPRTDFYFNGSTTEATQLRASQDKSFIGAVAGDDSLGPVFSYSAATNQFTPAGDVDGNISRVSTNGSRYMADNFLLDASLLLIGTFATGPATLFDVAVDPAGKIGYRTSTTFGATSNTIDVLDLATVLMTGSLPVGDSFGYSTPPFVPGTGHMSLSSDGTLIAVITNHGVALVQPHPIAFVSFASFDAAATVDLRAVPGRTRLDASGQFTPGAGSATINLGQSDFTLAVGSYALTLPAGSFQPVGSGGYAFHGTVGTAVIDAVVQPSVGGAYSFRLVSNGADLRGSTLPMALTLTIGTNDGSLTLDHGRVHFSSAPNGA
jgi:YVTN family beta-propeller protein